MLKISLHDISEEEEKVTDHLFLPISFPSFFPTLQQCTSCIVNSSGDALFLQCGSEDTVQFDKISGFFAALVLLQDSRLLCLNIGPF